jgi:tRNA threonylcarbamoyladenosine biosynthesis protein TsaB
VILLAADTSTIRGSIALKIQGGEPVERQLPKGRPHSETLLPAIESLLKDEGIGRHDVQTLMVGTGPGAFTGLRVGLATFKGWAFTADLPLIGVNSLDSIAFPFLVEGKRVLVTSDARKSEIYAALYGNLDDEGLPCLVRDIALLRPARLMSWLGDQPQAPSIALGNGLELVKEVLQDVEWIEPLTEVGRYPSAGSILRIGEILLSLGRTVTPADLVPFYVRPPDAVPAPRF